MGNACASTTRQGPTVSTAPRSTMTSLGRLLMAKREPPKSVGVSSQLGTVSPEPLLEQNTSSFVPFSCVSKRQQVLGWWARACKGAQWVESQCRTPAQCPLHEGREWPCLQGPSLGNPHETLLSVVLAFLWYPSVSPWHVVFCCGQTSACWGTLEVSGGQHCPLHGHCWQNTFVVWPPAFGHGLCSPLGLKGQGEPGALGRFEGYSCSTGEGCLRWVQATGNCRSHGVICFSISNSLARRALRINCTTPGRFAGMLSPILPWLRCHQHLSCISLPEWAAVTLPAVWLFPEGVTVNPCFHQQRLMSRGWIDLTWPLTSGLWASRLRPLPTQGKGDAHPPSHTSPPTCIALPISKAGREVSCPVAPVNEGGLPALAWWRPCTGKPILEIELKKLFFLNVALDVGKHVWKCDKNWINNRFTGLVSHSKTWFRFSCLSSINQHLSLP